MMGPLAVRRRGSGQTMQFVGRQSYTWGPGGSQAFNLNSLTGGEASPSTIKAGDTIICVYAMSFENTLVPNGMNDNPGFYGLTWDQRTSGGGSATSVLQILYQMEPLVDGAVTGSFFAAVAPGGCVAHFYVFRNLHPRRLSVSQVGSLDPAAITLPTTPALALIGVSGVHTSGTASFSGFGDATDTVQGNYDGSTRDVLSGVGLKRNIVASPYDPTAWTASALSAYRDATVLGFKEKVATSDAFRKVPILITGGAATGNEALNYGWAGTDSYGTAKTTTAVTLMGANAISFNGSQSVELDRSLPEAWFHPSIVMRDHDWTLEGAVRFNSTADPIILVRNYDKTNELMFSFLKNTGQLIFVSTTDGTVATQNVVQGTWTPSTGVDYFVRATCDYPTVRLFAGPVGGTATLIAKNTLSGPVYQGTGTTVMGRVLGGGAGLNGYMGEWRFSHEALNTTDDSFTAPSTPWPRT